jgi:hypothetical protein
LPWVSQPGEELGIVFSVGAAFAAIGRESAVTTAATATTVPPMIFLRIQDPPDVPCAVGRLHDVATVTPVQ